MSTADGYKSPQGVEASISAAARIAHEQEPSLTVSERIRLEHFNRFLCRVFSDGDESDWMLKGGTAVLARVPTARATTDVDLFRKNQTLDAALEDLRRLTAVDLGDFFRFEYVGHRGVVQGDLQPYTEGCRVTFDIYIGATRKGRLNVDLVVNAVVTDEVEIIVPANALVLPKLRTSAYRLYPAVDQIADKVCATFALYNGKPSSREKDLVDLVVFARTQDVDADKLARALRAEFAARSLPWPTEFRVPAAWGKVFSREAANVPACNGFKDVELAERLASEFLDPVFAGQVAGRWWDHDQLEWRLHAR